MMMNKNKFYIYFCFGMTTATIFIAVVFYQFGFRINSSESVSGIIWKLDDKYNEFKKGDYIAVCAPPEFITKHEIARHLESGHCAGKKPLLKKIVGMPGDHAFINANGIRINGKFIDNTKPILKKHQNMNETIPLDKFLIVGETHNSIDSRYFGLIQKQWVVGKVTLIY